ncbi:MAG: hypothetical protein ACRC0X_08870 [Brevinema sp.]
MIKKRNNLPKVCIAFMLIFSLSYTQEERMIQFRSGSLQASVDIYRGNFSVFDVDQLELDFVSLLFGGYTSPSSFFKIFIDRTPYTLDQMQAVYPLGVSLGSQIDAVFLANDDIQVETAFFSLDLLNNGDLNSLGLVINVSNMSLERTRQVGIKIMLDTDIGELRNDPLIYLPDGVKISNALIFRSNEIPPFLFIGQKNIAETRPIGKGFYLYPYISQNIPSSMLVANWRRISEQGWGVGDINPSFAYGKDNTKDVGISLCFGNFVLAPEQSEHVGFVISKQHTDVWPVLQEESVSQGVLNTDRFEVEELLKYNSGNIQTNPFRQQRERYRQIQLGYLQDTTISPRVQQRFQSISNLVADDQVWKYLYQLNWSIESKSKDLEQVLNQNEPPNNRTNNIIEKIFTQ